MTKVAYFDNLEEYIRAIVQQEILGEHNNCILRFQPKEKKIFRYPLPSQKENKFELVSEGM